jgi:CubicO group peptidase (beta-lactamase class C family)
MEARRLLPISFLFFLGLAPPAPASPPPGAPGVAPDFTAAARRLEAAVAEHAFPGCAVAVGTSRGVLWLEGFGRLDYGDGPAATPDTLYDLASLTKVVGTTSVVLRLVAGGRLALADPVARHVPGFQGGGREAVTIEHLLTHSSGLPAWRPPPREARGHGAVLAEVLRAPLEAPPGARERYSDLGFILLGEAAARAGGKPLEALEVESVFAPLGLRGLTRRPPAEAMSRIAPTEVVAEVAAGAAPAAGGPAAPAALRGIVHDENARAAGGITGHAGLFGSARDLAVFAGELLRGLRGESRVFPGELLRLFTARRGLVSGSSRGLGWDTPSGLSSAGTLLGKRAFGHTGFTGTSLWLDPDRDLYIILLSNRVHPTRENDRIARVRRELADAVVLCLEGRLRRL